jgi:hypothetical protein
MAEIREERDSTQQCISLCAEISTQVHETRDHIFENVAVAEQGHQVIVATSGDLISIKSVTAGPGSTTFGLMSDASITQLAEDISRVGGLSEHSRASSVASLADSVFSIASGSSKSSVLSPAGAGEMLIELFLSDNHLSLLFQEALKRVTADKFERNFCRILKRFSIELRREAENSQQRSIAHIVRYQARNSAHAIRNSIWSSRKSQVDVTPKFEMLHEPVNIDSDESDDDFGPDYEGDTDLQQSEDFIIASQAFVKLRHRLTLFIHSINGTKIDDEGSPLQTLNMRIYVASNPQVGNPKRVNKTDDKADLEKQELCTQESPTNLEKICTPGSTCFEPNVMECRDLPNTGLTQNMNPLVLNNCKMVYERSSCWRITRFVTQFREFWEPRVHEGKTRVRWKCVSIPHSWEIYADVRYGNVANICMMTTLNCSVARQSD